MRRIVNCINDKIIAFYSKSGKLSRFNEIVIKHLPSDLAANTHVSNFSQGVLTLEVNNNVWATQLRFEIPALLDSLRSKEKLFQVASIKILVRQQLKNRQKKDSKKIAATHKSYLLLNQEASEISDPELGQAFTKLANSIKQRLEKKTEE